MRADARAEKLEEEEEQLKECALVFIAWRKVIEFAAELRLEESRLGRTLRRRCEASFAVHCFVHC